MIVEIDQLEIPASRNGTSEGITVKAEKGVNNKALWNCTGTLPIIMFSIDNGAYLPTIVWSATVGIPEAEADETGIVVYPNPTRGELIINNYELKINNVEIVDVLGRVVFTRHCGLDPQSPAISVDASTLPAGIYFLRIQTANGVITKKIVKQ
jgi:hypothetical protein